MALREYAGGAKRTTLSASITSVSTSLNVTDGAGYPTGAAGPFAIAIDVGLAGEEKVLIATRTGNSMTVAASGRGYDGTTATAHSGGSVDHVITAVDIREANAHVNATSAGHTASAVGFTPTAGIAATNVQTAIAEVETDAATNYLARNAGGVTGQARTQYLAVGGAAVDGVDASAAFGPGNGIGFAALPTAVNKVAMVARGLAGQTSNIFEAQLSAGTVVGGWAADGKPVIGGPTTLTASGGALAAAPAAVAEYLSVVYPNGVIRKIALYGP